MEAISALLALVGGSIAILGTVCAVVVPLALLGVFGLIMYRRSQSAGAAKEAAQSWPHTTGTVMSSSVHSRQTGNSTSIYPVVVYQYKVDGKDYQAQNLKAGDQFMSVRIMGDAEKTVGRYPVGARVTVYYNPENPKEAALER